MVVRQNIFFTGHPVAAFTADVSYSKELSKAYKYRVYIANFSKAVYGDGGYSWPYKIYSAGPLNFATRDYFRLP